MKLELREAVVLLDKAALPCTVVQVPGGDTLVIPNWTGAFDDLQKPYKPYTPDASYGSLYDLEDAAGLLSKLARIKRNEKDEPEQAAMLQAAIDGLTAFIADEAQEISEGCPTCTHAMDCDCTDCECDHSLKESALQEAAADFVAVGLAEAGRRNSAKDTAVMRDIVRLVKSLGIDIEDEPAVDPEPAAPLAEAHVDQTADPASVTFRENGIEVGYVNLAEAEARFDDAAQTVWVTPIRPGWGNKRDNNFYPVDTVREATEGGLFNHLKMYKDHPRKSDEKDLPERSVKDWFATTREAEWDAVRQKPLVPVLVHDAADYKRWKDAPEQVSLSIIGGGMARPGEVEGRKGRILESIAKVKSVDWVTEAGAGGGIDFAESASEESDEMDKDELAKVTAEELAESNPDLYQHLVGMGKALAGVEKAEKAEAKAAGKTEAAKPDATEAPAKESADETTIPEWFKPFAAGLTAISTRESAAEAAAAIEAGKAAAKPVVAAAIGKSVLPGKVKTLVAGRFAEAAIAEGAYADEAALTTAVEEALKEAADIAAAYGKPAGVVGLGEGAASTADAGEVSVTESVKGDIEARWGEDRKPVADKLVWTAGELLNTAPVAVPTVGVSETAAPVSPAAQSVQESIAARM